jgi:tRNA-binding protein
MIKPLISTEVLERIDVRVGTILKVEDVAGSDKLVLLLVSFGDHVRTIVARPVLAVPESPVPDGTRAG